MQASRPVGDADRLPWLEPYRETIRATGPARRMPIALLAGLGVIAAAGAGYRYAQRSDEPIESAEARREAPSAQTVVPLPEPRPLVAPARPPEAEPLPPPAIEAPAPAGRVTVAKPAKKSVRSARPHRRIRSAGVETDRLRTVRAAQGERLAPRPTTRVRWPKMPSPGPAGQVIQLGAFSNPSRAQAAYQARTARYPLLARMPRVIVPVITKPDRRVLYVLRLGTVSRQQSHIVCRNLRASGDHCLVIG